MPKNLHTTLLFLLIFLLLFLAVTPLISFLRNKPSFMVTVRTYSMEPALTRGDMVFVWPTEKDHKYAKGQVVVYRSKEHGIYEWTMHRIVGGTAEKGFLTQGDANQRTDQETHYPPIQPKWIVAIAPALGDNLLKVPLIGYAQLFFSENTKIPFLFSVLMSTLALLLLWGLENA